MILIRNLRLPVGGDEGTLPALAAKALRLNVQDIRNFKITKKSLDARKKADIHWQYAVAFSAPGEEKLLRRFSGDKNIAAYTPFSYEIPSLSAAARPVIVGFGPAGMFAALVLAEAGLRPIVLERGSDVDSRQALVREFWESGRLSPRSNVQFGEGGAGTFSDGKLNTGTHDRRIAWVLEQLHRFGAPESITYDAKPHVGTDILAAVVKNLREHVIALGGEVHFNSQVTELLVEGGALRGLRTETGEELPCRQVILAIGHSARDTFEMLHSLGVPMARKAFSMGVRIEHKQDRIGLAQYGDHFSRLPAADYKLNCRFEDGESAYSFCMCPGGQVVAAASEEGGVVTNGMSYAARDGENANAALLVTLMPEDFPGEGILAGMAWQRSLEQAAYAYGGNNYLAPAQLVGDFLQKKASTGPGSVLPTYRPGVVWGDLRQVLPEKITDTLARAIPEFARRLQGFDDPDAVLTGPETRSSSPVRILRDESLMSPITGLYPCGEGAGYAGGITSAAVDGMRCAEALMNTLK